MKRASCTALLVAMSFAATSASSRADDFAASRAEDPAARVFEFQYETTVGPIEAGDGPVHIFIPLAARTEHQHVLDEHIVASIPGGIETEAQYGNRFWHGVLEVPFGELISVSIVSTVERIASRSVAPRTSEGLSASRRTELATFLRPNARVVVGHPILEPVLDEVRALARANQGERPDEAALARAIYDWVVDNVEYKKVSSGWGNGDTFWACNERYGNCTDFHALFISLARTEGIPARFEIGFPVPADHASGQIAGYHCWVEFYLPEVGWFPIDASEAFKQPERREFYYGAHPADRIHLTTGRDLRLGTNHRGPPLNYFVYPYVEVAGERYEGSIDRRFSYTAVEPKRTTRAAR